MARRQTAFERIAEIRGGGGSPRTGTAGIGSFARGAETSLKTADRALRLQEALAKALSSAAQEHMTQSKESAKQLRTMAMDELGYAAGDRAKSERLQAQAEEEYGKYDQEFKDRKTLYQEQYAPLEAQSRELAGEAGKYNQRVVDQASADASQQSQAMLQNVREYMSSMGLSLEGGKAAGLMKGYTSDAAKLSAQMRNEASRGERGRQLGSGRRAVQEEAQRGRAGLESDINLDRYKLEHSNRLSGIAENRRAASDQGRGRAMSGITTAANLPTTGLQALTTAAGTAGQSAGQATNLFGTQADYAVRSAEAKAGGIRAGTEAGKQQSSDARRNKIIGVGGFSNRSMQAPTTGIIADFKRDW
jgi:hypothetical protein